MSTSFPSYDERDRSNQHRDADSITLRERLLGTLVVFFVLLLAILLRSM